MKKVMESVDETTWRSSAAEPFAALWKHDPDSVYFWRISSNAAFVLNVDGQRHFLRFNLAEERGLSEVEAEIRILRALEKGSVRAAQPIPSLTGKLVETLEWNGDVYHAALFEGMPGEHPDDEDLTESQCLRWGEELGRLHAEFAAMPVQTWQGRGDWRRDLARMRQMLREDTPIVRRTLERAAAEMEALCAERPETLVHFDFEMDNLLWQDGKIAIIDFDDCRVYPPGADIEYAIRSLRTAEDAAQIAQPTQLEQPDRAAASAQPAQTQAFLHGYAQYSPYPLPSDRELKLFRRWHRLYLLASMRRELDAVAGEARPEWQSRLESRFAEREAQLRQQIETEAAEDTATDPATPESDGEQQ
ncbi:phosphotransferase enzyme family protein [Saccharibacillus sacchari]|uniref:Phosphotransferase n=1 Tax=Saccharibacillus sacchari TaxID=456493 RepID=A0ACC6P7H3_9BACL